MSSIQGLIDKFKARFRFTFEPHATDWACVGCGEKIYFTHRATDGVIEAELSGHECGKEVAA